ncbi:hypothetical protein OWV82_006133 [Melia azedarach]|uniref:Uncharacterized protein n=1 Tax=Melia azedarach TaxID=155640 RepID=A0ACC1YGL9_MELAZ|nr:hypothetical protein OWV82_006133 [Melia azedarach]
MISCVEGCSLAASQSWRWVNWRLVLWGRLLSLGRWINWRLVLWGRLLILGRWVNWRLVLWGWLLSLGRFEGSGRLLHMRGFLVIIRWWFLWWWIVWWIINWWLEW